MEILIKAGQLILSLSILVVLHELGHFIPAKLFKTRVEKFYLFFDPWFSLFKFKKGDTEYGIGWLPLGGYVKIAGMVDESMDKEQMKKEPEPWEFRSKPAWQRLIIMLGGVTVNIILGMAIYAMVLNVWGVEKLPVENIKDGFYYDEIFQDFGFQDGDKIVKIGGVATTDFDQLNKHLVLGESNLITIERNGIQSIIELPEGYYEALLESGKKRFIIPIIPFIVDSVYQNMPAELADFQIGDKIVGLDSIDMTFSREIVTYIRDHAGDSLLVQLNRNDLVIQKRVLVDTGGFIGIENQSVVQLLKIEKKKYDVLESIPAGIEMGINTLNGYVSSLKLIFTSAGAKQIGGFGTIGSLFSPTWDWESFWKLTALISIILAFMNILPIPALDGGHVMFLLYEIITRRAPNQKVMEYAQMVGMMLLLGLLLFANGNDVFKLFN
jgi:regulator of sigma E protease